MNIAQVAVSGTGKDGIGAGSLEKLPVASALNEFSALPLAAEKPETEVRLSAKSLSTTDRNVRKSDE